jgi:predicted MFS family arabinose efflux permease
MQLHEAMLARMYYRLPPPKPPRAQSRTRDGVGRRGIAAILFMCMFAAQSAQLVLTPVLTDVARAFGISTAGAGQIRTAAAVVATLAALTVGVIATRVNLRALLAVGIALLVGGSLVSIAAQSAVVLAAGQACTGAASSILVAAGVAAAATWSSDADRGRVVAWTLVGAPAAWVALMPVIGLLGGSSWRLAFVVPVAAAAAAGIALRRAPVARSQQSGAGLRDVLADATLRGWALSEVLAYAAWSGVLVYSGALFVESYGTSAAAVGLALGVGAAAYIPGTFLAQRAPAGHGRLLLAATGGLLAAGVLVFGVLRTGTVSSAIGFGVLCFVSGARTYLGSAVGLQLAPGKHAASMSVRAAAAQTGWILGSGVGGAALSVGGYSAMAVALSALYAGAALLHTPGLGVLIRPGREQATGPAPL